MLAMPACGRVFRPGLTLFCGVFIRHHRPLCRWTLLPWLGRHAGRHVTVDVTTA